MPSSTTSRLAAGKLLRARSIRSSMPRAADWRLRCSRTACSSSPRAWPRPKAKPARLASTDLPACADRRLEGAVGDHRQPARTRERTQQDGIQHAARLLGGLVHVEQDLALLRSFTARSRRPTSKLPSPMAERSPIDSTRWVEAIRVVRSGVTKPLKIMRPASSSSVASATSTSPIAGLSASTAGARAARRHDLEIVGRGAGALGDAGDLRRLHAEALALRRRHDPVAQHAAAVAAQRADEDGDRAAQAALAAAPRSPAERRRHFRRSHQPGFCTMSAL